MRRALIRTGHLILFTLVEYLRSYRILVELSATAAFFLVFFLLPHEKSIDSRHFFTLCSLFTLTLTLYTAPSVINMNDRPTTYLLLARRPGRTSYLAAVYLSALLIIVLLYLLITFAVLVVNPPTDIHIGAWLFGSVPLLLNVALLLALLLLTSPLVFSTGWRLLVLALLALAFSGNFFTGPARESMPATLRNLLDSVQTLLSWPLVPAFSGFALSRSLENGVYALAVIVAQLSLLVALLATAIAAFLRRDMLFQHE